MVKSKFWDKKKIQEITVAKQIIFIFDIPNLENTIQWLFIRNLLQISAFMDLVEHYLHWGRNRHNREAYFVSEYVKHWILFYVIILFNYFAFMCFKNQITYIVICNNVQFESHFCCDRFCFLVTYNSI